MKRVVGAFALLLVAAVAEPAAAQQGDPEMLRLLLARADTLLQSGNLDGGLDVLDRLMERTEGIDRDSPEPVRLLLQRALEARALARWESGQRDGLDADLDRLIQLDPGYDLAELLPPDDLITRFTRRRERLVGYLRVGYAPADARVFIDDRPIEEIGDDDIIPVLAGDHVVRAERRGFAPDQVEASVRANRTEGVGLTLERASATIQVATHPAGAQIMLDGELVGTTLPVDGQSASAPLVVEGLLPGWYELEITLRDHRPFRQRIEVPTLSDYDLGTLDMRLALGSVTLSGVPVGSDIQVDGSAITEFTASGDTVRVSLPVGGHEVVVGAAGGRVWAGQVDIADGGAVSRRVDLAPGLAFLGVTGGDALDQEGATEPLLRALSTTPGWHLLDRSYSAVGLSAEQALRLGDGSQEELRCRFEDEIPAALYLIAVVDDDDPGIVHLSTWAAGATLPSARVQLPLGDPDALRAAIDRLLTPSPQPRAWHGLILVDSALGPVVAAVSANSPGHRAGFAVADRITGIDGDEAGTAADFARRTAAAGPQASLAVTVSRGERSLPLRLDLDTSAQVARAADPVVATSWWAQAAADIGAGGVGQPVWALRTQQALLLMDAGRHEAAINLLWNAAAPEDSPFGQATVDYWLGVLLAEGPDADLGAARNVLNQAASVGDARLFHNDGPLLGPRARARLARIAAALR